MGVLSIAHFDIHPCMTIHESIDVAEIIGEVVSPGIFIINFYHQLEQNPIVSLRKN